MRYAAPTRQRKSRAPMTQMEPTAASKPDPQAQAQAGSVKREVLYRHSVVVRVTHWIGVLCVSLLLMSGLRLFNYHPALYWGNVGYRGVPSFIAIGAIEDTEKDELTGITRI